MVTDNMVEAFANSFWPTSSEIVIDRNSTYIRAALEAALSASDAEPVCTVAVKALEWVYVSYGGIAHTPFGMYQARFNMHGTDTRQYEMIPAGGTLPVSFHDSLDAAKSAAQADYETRIRAALVSPADTSPVFTVAQIIEKIKDYGQDSLPTSEYRLACDDLVEAFEALAAAPKEASHE